VRGASDSGGGRLHVFSLCSGPWWRCAATFDRFASGFPPSPVFRFAPGVVRSVAGWGLRGVDMKQINFTNLIRNTKGRTTIQPVFFPLLGGALWHLSRLEPFGTVPPWNLSLFGTFPPLKPSPLGTFPPFEPSHFCPPFIVIEFRLLVLYSVFRILIKSTLQNPSDEDGR
jgi:hypothetical protein